MNDSKGSAVIEGGQGTQGRLAGVGVVPGGCLERQQTLEDPCGHTFIRAATVSLQVELALQGVIHGFDELAQGLLSPSASEVHAMVEGAIHLGTSMEVEETYVDHQLWISHRTVRNHVSNIFTKLQGGADLAP